MLASAISVLLFDDDGIVSAKSSNGGGAALLDIPHSTDNCRHGLSSIDCSLSTSIEFRTGSNES
jgi:hypothetical protein